jgi:hypothetical protein
MKTITPAVLVLALIFLFSSCGKKEEQDSQKEETKKEETTRKQEEPKKVNEDSLRKAEENTKKERFVKFALEEEKMINDEKGQFATDAEASSSYGDAKEKENYSPWQATGKPNVENNIDDGRSWVSKEADKGIEWLRLKFEKAVNATEVRVRQNYMPGAIIKIELIDTDGKSHTVWEGIDKTKYETDMISWFYAKFEKTTYKTKEVKITLATNTVSGWNEIDAVQLMGE